MENLHFLQDLVVWPVVPADFFFFCPYPWSRSYCRVFPRPRTSCQSDLGLLPLLHSSAPFLGSLARTGCLPCSSALLGSCLTRTGCLMHSLAPLCGLARTDCLLRSTALLSSCLARAGCLLRGSVPLCGLACAGGPHALSLVRVWTRFCVFYLWWFCCDVSVLESSVGC
jgi:hypothetical protein